MRVHKKPHEEAPGRVHDVVVDDPRDEVEEVGGVALDPMVKKVSF